MTAASIISTMGDEALFAPWFRGSSWDAWRCVLKAAFCISMTPDEVELFRTLAERNPPGRCVRELWIIAGRRSGKDSIASLICGHLSALADCAPHLRPGERALVLALACDRAQAKILLNYVRGYFEAAPLLGAMIRRQTIDGFELNNGIDVAIGTNNFRSVRGRALLGIVLDECAFYADERSASPDLETYRALLPGMSTMPGAILIGISSPYRKSGLLYEKHRAHFGKNDDDVLVIQASSLQLNPLLDERIVADAIESDPAAARAEWLGQFRDDIAAFVDPEVVAAAVVAGCHELPFVGGVKYVAFTDPSGGSSDSFTLGIAHAEGNKRVLDLVREVRPKLSPEAVTREFAQTIKSYGLTEVTGDRYAGEWPRERFREHGITYRPSERTKSELYLELLPLLNSQGISLVENKRLSVQLSGLERRTARGGRDSIDHGPGAHDDVANAAAGALVLASPKRAIPDLGAWGSIIEEFHRPEGRFHRASGLFSNN